MELTEYLRTHKPTGFSRRPYYSADGESLTYYFSNEPSFAKRIDDFLTVYCSIADSRLVGCQIKGLPRALELLGDFGLLIEDGRVKLGILFMACAAQSFEPDSMQYYRELGKMLGKTETEIDLPAPLKDAAAA